MNYEFVIECKNLKTTADLNEKRTQMTIDSFVTELLSMGANPEEIKISLRKK